MPFSPPSINPKILLRFVYDETLPSSKNNSKLVNNLNTIMDIKNMIAREKIIIMVALIDIYFDIKKDKST